MPAPTTPTTRFPLHIQASEGDDLAVAELIAQGAAVDATDEHGRTAILTAAMAGHHNTVKLLIDLGADVDCQDNTCLNPFLLGCVTGDEQLVRTMLAAGTDLTRLTRFGGNGLLPASEKGFVNIVEELVTSTNINVNHTNWVGWTALIEAIILNDGGPRQQRIVRLLLDHGADPQLTDKYGVTPRELAEQKGYTRLAELIAAAGG